MTTTIGQTSGIAIAFFVVILSITLGITYWAARTRKTMTTAMAMVTHRARGIP